MARYVDAIDLAVSQSQAFDFIADFARTAEWDPGVVEAEPLTPGPPRLGSRFRVVVRFLGRSIPMTYEITTFDRPHRLVLRGGDQNVDSTDEITFGPRGSDASRVTYEARLELRGLRRLADPILDVLMQHVGRVAVQGLRNRLAAADEQAGERLRFGHGSH